MITLAELVVKLLADAEGYSKTFNDADAPVCPARRVFDEFGDGFADTLARGIGSGSHSLILRDQGFG